MKYFVFLFLFNSIHSGGCLSKPSKKEAIPKTISLAQGIYVGMGPSYKDFKRYNNHFYRISNDKTHYVLMHESLNLAIQRSNHLYQMKSQV